MIKRQFSPNAIAVFTSLFIALLSSLALWLVMLLLDLRAPYYLFIIQSLLLFWLSLAVYRYALMRFIYAKLRIIYKTIGKPLKFQNEIGTNVNSNIMRSVERDVGEWAINKNKQIRELRKLETYRKEFVGNVSHELRTPIFNAQGYVETLLDGALEDPVKGRQYLEKALANIERLDTIVSDLLEISKFEAGQIHLDKKAFDIIKLTKKVFDQYQHMAKEQEAELVIDTRFKKMYVWADKKRIMQVLENLISNAIKYGKKGGTVKVSYYDLDENILIEVSDDGPGISEEHLPRVFERFFRGDKSRARKIGGTGLGLSIVKNIVEAHDQSINVRSEMGAGTTFSFTLEKAKDYAEEGSVIVDAGL
jgi:two-component system phosphate regulon sensor histidine kinase PhoR